MNVLPYEGDDDVISGLSNEDDGQEYALLRKLTEKAVLSNYKEKKRKQQRNRCTINHAKLNKQIK